MDAKRFAQIEEVFHQVESLTPEQQRARIKALCDGDEDLEHQVLELISHSKTTSDWVGRVVTSASRELSDDSLDLSDTIAGAYQIEGLIGEGGMGEVYAARQTTPIERNVALKVIRADRVSPQLLDRFRAELANLALMQHAGIAQVFDAGETPDGRPFFAMERVEGQPLTTYSEQQKLTLREKLEVFSAVCAAVNHAHQRGVIHRDLKPSNIIVSKRDGQANVKVIDFGIAKAISQDNVDFQHTVAGQILGSPDYMSPEQANSLGIDVDVRTDVYALGAVLYELLTGTTPLRLAGISGQYEMLSAITTTEFERPSQRLQAQAQTDPRLIRALGIDLDWIVMKALAKQREDRYGSVADLADDITRYLTNEPVAARPPGKLYELKKFIRRHPTGVSVSLVSVALLVIGLVGTLWGLRAAQQAELLAERRAASSEQAVNYLLEMFANANPELHQGDKITVDELIKTAAADSDNMFPEEPHLRVDMQYRLAEVLSRMSSYDDAIALTQKAMALDAQTAPFPSDSTAQGLDTIVRSHMMIGDYETALIYLDEAEQLATLLPNSQRPVAAAQIAYGRAFASFYIDGSKLVGMGVYGHDQSVSIELAQRAVDLYREVDPASLAMADALELLGYNLTYTPRNAEAFAPLQQALDIKEELFGPTHTSLATTLGHLSDAHLAAGDHAASLKLINRLRSITETAYEPGTPQYNVGVTNYATYLSEIGDHEAAVRVWRQFLDSNANQDSRESYEQLLAHQYVIQHLFALGRLDEAEQHLDDASAIMHKSDMTWGLVRIYFGYSNLAALRGDEEELYRNIKMAIELSESEYDLDLAIYGDFRKTERFKALVERHKQIVGSGDTLSIAEHNLKYHSAP